MAADFISNPDVKYFLLAGCYHKDEYGKDIKGRILSIYDVGDKKFGSCAEAVEGHDNVEYKEIAVDTGYGHGMGSRVRDEWFDPVIEWISK